MTVHTVHAKILEKLGKIPFYWPPSQQLQAELWFVSELNNFQENVSNNFEDQADFWVKMPNDLLHHCATKKAQQYVWHQFNKALSYAEPPLYKAGYTWLLEHKNLATPTKRDIFQWSEKDFCLNTLLSAVCELPSKISIEYITQWMEELQYINVEPPSLLTRIKKIKEPDLRSQSIQNEELWMHVLLPAFPYLPPDVLNAFKTPYLPCIFYADNPESLTNLFNSVPTKCQSWVITNMLDRNDFVANSVQDYTRIIRHLCRYIDTIVDVRIQNFLIWDLLYRSDDPKQAMLILEKYAPSTAFAIKSLDLENIENIRHTLYQQWHHTESIYNIALPLNFNDDCTML